VGWDKHKFLCDGTDKCPMNDPAILPIEFDKAVKKGAGHFSFVGNGSHAHNILWAPPEFS